MATLTGLTTVGIILVVVLLAALLVCFLVLLGSFLLSSENARHQIHHRDSQKRHKNDSAPREH